MYHMTVSVGEDEMMGLYRQCDAGMFIDTVSWINSRRRVCLNVDIIHAAEVFPPVSRVCIGRVVFGTVSMWE